MAPAMPEADPAMAVATVGFAADPREKILEPMAMKVPHSPQKMRPGGLGASQLQQLTMAAGATGLGLAGSGRDDSDEDGMGAPAAGRRSAADDTSESHSPQNAVSAWTGAPHAGQMS